VYGGATSIMIGSYSYSNSGQSTAQSGDTYCSGCTVNVSDVAFINSFALSNAGELWAVCAARVVVLAQCSLVCLCVVMASALTCMIGYGSGGSYVREVQRDLDFVCAIDDCRTGLWRFTGVSRWRARVELQSRIHVNLLCGIHDSVWTEDGAQQHPHLWQPGRDIHYRRCVAIPQSHLLPD
jgi:hypothetical protein